MIERHRQAFIEEASELLGELEVSLLELEEKPDDPDVIGRVFRALHTIKGSGAMFGFDAISSFTHELETVFDGVRDGRERVTSELIGITLDARDHIQTLLRAPEHQQEDLAAASNRILDRLLRASPSAINSRENGSADQIPPLDAGPEQQESRTYRIRFDPHPDIFLSGTNPILLFRELAQLGDCSVVAHLDRIPQLSDFDPDSCYTHWEAVLTTAAAENAIRDVFIFVEDRGDLTVQCIKEAGSQGRLRLGEIPRRTRRSNFGGGGRLSSPPAANW